MTSRDVTALPPKWFQCTLLGMKEENMSTALSLLLVEDERDIRQGMLDGIDWDAYGIGTVREASNGKRALEILRDSNFDIILSDVVMPLMDGIEFVRTARSEGTTAKVVFISGYQDMEYLKSAFKLEAIDYIFKPVDIDELDAVLTKVSDACRCDRAGAHLMEEMNQRLEATKPVMRERFFRELLTRGFSDNGHVTTLADFNDGGTQ